MIEYKANLSKVKTRQNKNPEEIPALKHPDFFNVGKFFYREFFWANSFIEEIYKKWLLVFFCINLGNLGLYLTCTDRVDSALWYAV